MEFGKDDDGGGGTEHDGMRILAGAFAGGDNTRGS